MMGWTVTITELYDKNDGVLLGYEVQETLSAITYNTLWFNLGDTTGISTLKFLEAPLEDSNPYLVYINGQAEVFETKLVGGFSTKMLSRRYDIELRKQYFYQQDGENLVQVEMLIPMLFVQEENLSTLVNDINASNDGLSFSLDVSSTIQNQIISDYDSLVEPFILQKDEFTVQVIIDFIGSAYGH